MTNKTNNITFTPLYQDLKEHSNPTLVDEMVCEIQGHDNGIHILESNEGFQKLKKAFQEQEYIDFVREVK